ncbi:hypothetical protein EIN_379570 [Entamoeba invadens IP1]|uniref:Uncharacterized protein n=1 Tax=Entamoeba invadens IP1 TaxID=370355 RepID=A0A0A1UAS0_ENTIV|nr:hypothetical protein EIN_379570 [Entamoeba invadens IP1]ELP92080.1 hypothetical protein EIN_379570 [Entamoeba invadens IP1]|eukprot:XP_004258851.1 hypothetical protein EIN_379570 [Entamoeba invadens IP1]
MQTSSRIDEVAKTVPESDRLEQSKLFEEDKKEISVQEENLSGIREEPKSDIQENNLNFNFSNEQQQRIPLNEPKNNILRTKGANKPRISVAQTVGTSKPEVNVKADGKRLTIYNAPQKEEGLAVDKSFNMFGQVALAPSSSTATNALDGKRIRPSIFEKESDNIKDKTQTIPLLPRDENMAPAFAFDANTKLPDDDTQPEKTMKLEPKKILKYEDDHTPSKPLEDIEVHRDPIPEDDRPPLVVDHSSESIEYVEEKPQVVMGPNGGFNIPGLTFNFSMPLTTTTAPQPTQSENKTDTNNLFTMPLFGDQSTTNLSTPTEKQNEVTTQSSIFDLKQFSGKQEANNNEAATNNMGSLGNFNLPIFNIAPASEQTPTTKPLHDDEDKMKNIFSNPLSSKEPSTVDTNKNEPFMSWGCLTTPATSSTETKLGNIFGNLTTTNPPKPAEKQNEMLNDFSTAGIKPIEPAPFGMEPFGVKNELRTKGKSNSSSLQTESSMKNDPISPLGSFTLPTKTVETNDKNIQTETNGFGNIGMPTLNFGTLNIGGSQPLTTTLGNNIFSSKETGFSFGATPSNPFQNTTSGGDGQQNQLGSQEAEDDRAAAKELEAETDTKDYTLVQLNLNVDAIPSDTLFTGVAACCKLSKTTNETNQVIENKWNLVSSSVKINAVKEKKDGIAKFTMTVDEFPRPLAISRLVKGAFIIQKKLSTIVIISLMKYDQVTPEREYYSLKFNSEAERDKFYDSVTPFLN